MEIFEIEKTVNNDNKSKNIVKIDIEKVRQLAQVLDTRESLRELTQYSYSCTSRTFY
jgi:hypothetical protein